MLLEREMNTSTLPVKCPAPKFYCSKQVDKPMEKSIYAEGQWNKTTIGCFKSFDNVSSAYTKLFLGEIC